MTVHGSGEWADEVAAVRCDPDGFVIAPPSPPDRYREPTGDTQRLVPAGPLLDLLGELASRQAECIRDDNDDAAFAYGYAVHCLSSLLGETPEPNAQESSR